MPFFQNSVINKYIQNLDKQTIHNAYAKFRSHFHNAIIQENIRGSKEEQYQGEFLIDLFVNVLGYTKNPTPNFNLTTEYKNVKDSKKADGAIIINDVVKAVIELKGTNTTDLNKIETQAFGYKNNQPECEYVITSNFEKIRFYIDNAIEYIEFNLFTLTEKEFELLYICLSYDSIAKGLPKQLKDESVSQEDLITKKLYKDYSVFKSELYHSLVKLNPQYNPLELFKKSQKLLDRFLFIFFAEDRQLLPTNLIFRINKEWQQLREMRIEVSLYDRYKIYFNDLDQGARVSLPAFSQTASKQKEEFEIYAYNGGLFKKDDLLNDIKIEDDLLFLHTEKLSNYDFASEIDVNVLGHIFENSLNDVDEIKAQLEGQEIDKTKTKRKKDGVFYTPKYITKYIVDNTVGKLCLEKKEALQLTESDYTIDKKRPKKTTQALTDTLNEYRNWLLQLTICDPACGSGAFLNQALDFLITEHRYIDELQAKLFGDALVLSDVEGSILENNLFGVDINEESVEIAKLSLWLRTAQPNRKLNDLNSNIKCGNSLIDDVAIAGDKAFNWKNEFSKIFDKGGFDTVIGNPPYVTSKEEMFDKEVKDFFISKYKTAAYQIDLYILFLEKSTKLISRHGISCFIVPNSWLNNLFLENVRRYFLSNTYINEIVSMPSNIFLDANVDTIIVTFSNLCENALTRLSKFSNGKYDILSSLNQLDWLKGKDAIINVHTTKDINNIFNKINQNSLQLDTLSDIGRGVGVYHKRVGHTKDFIASDPYQSSRKMDETFLPYLRGRNVQSGYLTWKDDSYISYGKWLAEPREAKFFTGQRIVLRQIPSTRLIVSYLNEDFVIDQSVFIARFYDDSKYSPKSIMSILGSKLLSFYFRFNYSEFDELFPKVKLQHFKSFPISKNLSVIDLKLQSITEVLLILKNDFQEQTKKFQRTLQRKFELEDLPKKLEEWYLLSYSDFIKELAKKKIKLSLSDEAEWEEYFNTESKKALEVKSKIDATDKEIDQLVYKLYDLTEEEIKIVEGN